MTNPLRLRPITESDGDLVADLFSRPEVARWSGTGEPLASPEEVTARLHRWLSRGGDSPFAGVFVVEPDEEPPAGVVLLVPLPASNGFSGGSFEIGWHLLPSTWGRGYATRAAKLLIERAREAGLDELFAVTDPDNARSQAVCLRLGMEDLGLRPDYYDRVLRTYRLDLRAA